MTASLRPVPDAPALVLDPGTRGGSPTLVVADLHLGLGASSSAPGGPPEGSPERMSTTLGELASEFRARRLIVAGDVKHPIVGTPAPLRPVVFAFFASLLGRGLRVEVVLGNHDVGLVPHLPREVHVHPAGGTVRENVGIFHGHCWPDPRVLRASTLVTGHLHPGYRFASTADHPDGKRRCWVRVQFAPGALGVDRRGRTARSSASGPRELIVLPAFNPLAGAESLNRERPRRGRSFLFHRFLSRGEARAYLLDGTDVGRLLTSPKHDGTSRASSPTSRGR